MKDVGENINWLWLLLGFGGSARSHSVTAKREYSCLVFLKERRTVLFLRTPNSMAVFLVLLCSLVFIPPPIWRSWYWSPVVSLPLHPSPAPYHPKVRNYASEMWARVPSTCSVRDLGSSKATRSFHELPVTALLSRKDNDLCLFHDLFKQLASRSVLHPDTPWKSFCQFLFALALPRRGNSEILSVKSLQPASPPPSLPLAEWENRVLAFETYILDLELMPS